MAKSRIVTYAEDFFSGMKFSSDPKEALTPGSISGGIMANVLCSEKKEQIRQAYLVSGSIKNVAQALKISRNTVRRLIRAEGMTLPMVPRVMALEPTAEALPTRIEALDFKMLEKLFSRSGEPGAAKDFEIHIKSMAVEIAAEIGVCGRLDVVRLEVAVCEYVQYRRFLICALNVSDQNYAGPFMRSHDKAARAGLHWVEASNKAFENFERTVRSLEIKYGKRGPEALRSQVYVQNQQVNVSGKIGKSC